MAFALKHFDWFCARLLGRLVFNRRKRPRHCFSRVHLILVDGRRNNVRALIGLKHFAALSLRAERGLLGHALLVRILVCAQLLRWLRLLLGGIRFTVGEQQLRSGTRWFLFEDGTVATVRADVEVLFLLLSRILLAKRLLLWKIGLRIVLQRIH